MSGWMWGCAPRVAQFRVMLRVWGEALAAVLGRWALWGSGDGGAGVCLWAAELALIGAVAEMVMVLPMAMYFHRATMFALPANMVSVPLVAVLAPMGVVTFAAAVVSPWLAVVPGGGTAVLLHGDYGGDWASECCAGGGCAGAGAGVVGGVGGGGGVGVLLLGCAAVAGVVGVGCGGVAAGDCGDGAVAGAGGGLAGGDGGDGDRCGAGRFPAGGESPEGRTMLVDAGGPVGSVKEAAEVQSAFDVGEEVVSPYLWSRRMRRLDVMVLSHAHSDHMGGMAAVMRSFRPRELWVGVDPDSEAYRALLAEAEELGVVVRHFHAGDEVSWGGVEVKVLAPEVGYVNAGQPVNNDSLVLRLEYGRASVLLEGDAEAPSERAMVANGEDGGGDAAEGGAPWESDLDYAGVSGCGGAEGCGGVGGQGEYVWASASGGD